MRTSTAFIAAALISCGPTPAPEDTDGSTGSTGSTGIEPETGSTSSTSSSTGSTGDDPTGSTSGSTSTEGSSSSTSSTGGSGPFCGAAPETVIDPMGEEVSAACWNCVGGMCCWVDLFLGGCIPECAGRCGAECVLVDPDPNPCSPA